MAITKKIRFEVFKRDAFICQYCGKTPPDVTLEVDHINPKSKGGSDDINNLITACFDCNRGKSNHKLTLVPNSVIQNSDILIEKENQYKQYQALLRKIEKRKLKEVEIIDNIYNGYFCDHILTEKFKIGSVKKFINLLGIAEVESASHIAFSKFSNGKKKYDKSDSIYAIKYFCGICWNKIRENGL